MNEPRVWNFQELLRRRERGRGRLFGTLALAAFVPSAFVLIRSSSVSGLTTVRISAGSTEGLWYQFLLSLNRESAAAGLSIEPVVTTGTLDMLDRVDRGELDFAMIQGGYDLDRYRDIRQVAGLSVFPIHLLVKKEYHDAVLADLRQLRGKTINLGSGKRTGTYWLSREILAFAGLAPTDYRPSGMNSAELQAEHDRDRLPDGIFIATMPPSGLVRHLVVRFGYRLVPLPFGDAFRLSALREAASPAPTEGIPIRKEHLVDTTIPAYAYQVSPPVPPQATATLGSRVLLITNRQTDRSTVHRLLEVLLSSRFAHALQPPLDIGIVRQHAEAPWHLGALDYRRRDQPLVTAELIGVLSNALQLALPLGGGLLLLWGWVRNRVLTRRERRFDRFIALVSGVERRALELEPGATRDHEAIRQLHRELCTIKDAALERIVVGEASDNSLVMSLFAHIGDVRALLAERERSWDDRDPGPTAVGSDSRPDRLEEHRP